jgi:hypothetical protein
MILSRGRFLILLLFFVAFQVSIERQNLDFDDQDEDVTNLDKTALETTEYALFPDTANYNVKKSSISSSITLYLLEIGSEYYIVVFATSKINKQEIVHLEDPDVIKEKYEGDPEDFTWAIYGNTAYFLNNQHLWLVSQDYQGNLNVKEDYHEFSSNSRYQMMSGYYPYSKKFVILTEIKGEKAEKLYCFDVDSAGYKRSKTVELDISPGYQVTAYSKYLVDDEEMQFLNIITTQGSIGEF